MVDNLFQFASILHLKKVKGMLNLQMRVPFHLSMSLMLWELLPLHTSCHLADNL